MDLKLPELGVLKTCKIRLLIGVLKPPDSGGLYYLIQMVLGVGGGGLKPPDLGTPRWLQPPELGS